MQEGINKMLILISLIINYPVIQQWGIEISKIICLVTSADGRKIFKKMIDMPFVGSTDDSISGRQLSETLSEDYKYILACYPVVGKSELARAVLSSVLSNSYEGRNVEALPILVCDELSPLEIDDNYKFHVWIEEIPNIQMNLEELVTKDTDLSKAKQEYEHISSEYVEEVEKAIVAATALLKEYCNGSDSGMDYDSLCETMRTMIIQAREYEDMSDFKDLFIQSLFDWTDYSDFSFATKDDLIVTDEKALDRVVISDGEFTYMKESLLREILLELEKNYSFKVMKDALLNLGMIKTDKKPHTVKMLYKGSDGKSYRTRMIRFINSTLVDETGTSFFEKCITNAKEY